jgi:hypothetical protein
VNPLSLSSSRVADAERAGDAYEKREPEGVKRDFDTGTGRFKGL